MNGTTIDATITHSSSLLEKIAIGLFTANPIAITIYAKTHPEQWNYYIEHSQATGTDIIHAGVYLAANLALLAAAYHLGKK